MILAKVWVRYRQLMAVASVECFPAMATERVIFEYQSAQLLMMRRTNRVYGEAHPCTVMVVEELGH